MFRLCLARTGIECETNIDECASNPCTNSATCSDQVNHYICICPAGFTGKGCYLLTLCSCTRSVRSVVQAYHIKCARDGKPSSSVTRSLYVPQVCCARQTSMTVQYLTFRVKMTAHVRTMLTTFRASVQIALSATRARRIHACPTPVSTMPSAL